MATEGQEVKTLAGCWYTITCTAAVTVTEDVRGTAVPLAELKKAGVAGFRASQAKVCVVTDGEFVVLPTEAPAALGFCGGGGGDESDVYAAVDVAPEGTTEENYNAYGFGFVMPRAGRIKGLTLECRDNNTATPENTPVWLKVWRGTTLIARSENSQQHAVAAVLRYSFAEPFAVLEGEEIKVSFHSEDGMETTAFQMGRQCCLRVVAKDPATPGGLLGAAGGYGSESDATQRSWQAKHTWHMLVGVFAPAEHVEDTIAHWTIEQKRVLEDSLVAADVHIQDTTVHITEAERTTWNEAAAREVPEAYTLTAEEVRAVVPIAWQGTGTMPRIVVGAVAFGLSASAKGAYSVAVGYEASVREDYSVAIGYSASANSGCSIAVGFAAVCSGSRSVAIGQFAKSQDDDLIVMSVGETTGGSIRTHFCFMGKGSPLANTYEGGEACMGYVVADGDGNLVTSGTRKLSELFTNNVGTFCPTGFVLPSA